MATNFRGKICQIRRPTSFVALALYNGLKYRKADGHVNSAVNWSTSCTNLVRFGAVTVEFTCLNFVYSGRRSALALV